MIYICVVNKVVKVVNETIAMIIIKNNVLFFLSGWRWWTDGDEDYWEIDHEIEGYKWNKRKMPYKNIPRLKLVMDFCFHPFHLNLVVIYVR